MVRAHRFIFFESVIKLVPYIIIFYDYRCVLLLLDGTASEVRRILLLLVCSGGGVTAHLETNLSHIFFANAFSFNFTVRADVIDNFTTPLMR